MTDTNETAFAEETARGLVLPGTIRRVTRRGMIGTTMAATLALPALAQNAAPAAGGPTAVIDVSRARTAPIPIAIPAFGGGTDAGDLVGVISNDLNRSGLFRIVDGSGVANASGGTPDFGVWKGTGAQALVTGTVTQSGSQLRVEFRLWDVLPGTQIPGHRLYDNDQQLAAHRPYHRRRDLSSGCWARRAISTPASSISRPPARATAATKRLAIMDQDGANNRFLTDGSWLVLTPRFNPTRDQIAFMSYASIPAAGICCSTSAPARRRLVGDFRTA